MEKKGGEFRREGFFIVNELIKADNMMDVFIEQSDQIYARESRKAQMAYKQAESMVKADPQKYGVPESCILGTCDLGYNPRRVISKVAQDIVIRAQRSFEGGELGLRSIADAYGSIVSKNTIDLDDISSWPHKSWVIEDGRNVVKRNIIYFDDVEDADEIISLFDEFGLLRDRVVSKNPSMVKGYTINMNNILPIHNAIITHVMKIKYSNNNFRYIKEAFTQMGLSGFADEVITKYHDQNMILLEKLMRSFDENSLNPDQITSMDIIKIFKQPTRDFWIPKYAEVVSTLDILGMEYRRIHPDAVDVDFSFFSRRAHADEFQGQDFSLVDGTDILHLEVKSIVEHSSFDGFMGSGYHSADSPGLFTIISDIRKASRSASSAVKGASSYDQAVGLVDNLRADIISRIEFMKLNPDAWNEIAKPGNRGYTFASPFGFITGSGNSFDFKKVSWNEARIFRAIQESSESVPEKVFQDLVRKGIIDSRYSLLDFELFLDNSVVKVSLGLDCISPGLPGRLRGFDWSSSSMSRPFFLDNAELSYDDFMKLYPDYYPGLGGRLKYTQLPSINGKMQIDGSDIDFHKITLPVKDPDFPVTQYLHLYVVKSDKSLIDLKNSARINGQPIKGIIVNSHNSPHLEGAILDSLHLYSTPSNLDEMVWDVYPDSSLIPSGTKSQFTLKFDGIYNSDKFVLPALEQSNRIGGSVQTVAPAISIPTIGSIPDDTYHGIPLILLPEPSTVKSSFRFVNVDSVSRAGYFKSSKSSVNELVYENKLALSNLIEKSVEIRNIDPGALMRALFLADDGATSKRFVSPIQDVIRFETISKALADGGLPSRVPDKYIETIDYRSITFKVQGQPHFVLLGEPMHTFRMDIIYNDMMQMIADDKEGQILFKQLSTIYQNYNAFDLQVAKMQYISLNSAFRTSTLNADPLSDKLGDMLRNIRDGKLWNGDSLNWRHGDKHTRTVAAFEYLLEHNQQISGKSITELTRNTHAILQVDNWDKLLNDIDNSLLRYEDFIQEFDLFGVLSNKVALDSISPPTNSIFDYDSLRYVYNTIDEKIYSELGSGDLIDIYEMIKDVSIDHNFDLIDQLTSYDDSITIQTDGGSTVVYYSNFTFTHNSLSFDSRIYLNLDNSIVYIANETGFYHSFDLLINGTWNSDIFFSPSGLNSGEIQFNLDLGMIPLVDFSYLAPVFNAGLINYLRGEIDFYNSQTDIYAYITLLMGPTDFGYLTMQYKKMIADQHMSTILLYDTELGINVTLSSFHDDVLDQYISNLFSYMDDDIIGLGSRLLQSSILQDTINDNNRIINTRSSNHINSDIRRKVFGPNLEFVDINAQDFFDTSIFLYYDSMMDSVAINPTTNPLFYDDGLEYYDAARSLQIFHGLDYSGVTPTTTMSNLQEFLRKFEYAYQSKVPNQSGTGFGDVWDLVKDHGWSAMGYLKRDTTNIPWQIRLRIVKLSNLNLYDTSSQILFQEYLERMQFVLY